MRPTPLETCHERAGARFAPFAGWRLPILYSSIQREAQAVRQHAGLFDVSHMGRLRITGKGRVPFLQVLVTADVASMKLWRVRYALALRGDGTVLDDLLVSRERGILHLCVNAGNHAKMTDWLEQHVAGHEVRIEDVTARTAMMALQGPDAAAILAPLTDIDLATVRGYRFRRGTVLGREAVVSRTGYTGEDGFEITVESGAAPEIWEALAADARVTPAGLGARDILRLEAGMPLFGHEIDDQTTPIEAGLMDHVDMEAPFTGRPALERLLSRPPARHLVGLVAEGRRIPRQGQSVLRDEQKVGEIVSGGLSPTLGKPIATSYLHQARSAELDSLLVDIRGRTVTVRVVPLPFYSRQGRQPSPPSTR